MVSGLFVTAARHTRHSPSWASVVSSSNPTFPQETRWKWAGTRVTSWRGTFHMRIIAGLWGSWPEEPHRWDAAAYLKNCSDKDEFESTAVFFFYAETKRFKDSFYFESEEGCCRTTLPGWLWPAQSETPRFPHYAVEERCELEILWLLANFGSACWAVCTQFVTFTLVFRWTLLLFNGQRNFPDTQLSFLFLQWLNRTRSSLGHRWNLRAVKCWPQLSHLVRDRCLILSTVHFLQFWGKK